MPNPQDAPALSGMSDLEKAVLEGVAGLEKEAIELLCALVAEDSQLGKEQSAQDLMAEQFSSLGLEVERFEIDLEEIRGLPGFSPPVIDVYSGRENVVGLSKPSGNPIVAKGLGKSLIFNGHIDVVPPGPSSLWSNDPFQPVVRDGRVYGRGSGDMKAGIVAYCMALAALHKLDLRPASNVILQSVIEEECTGNGALACLAKGYRADAAIIPEPFHQQLMIAQLGVMWLQVHLTGKPAHVLDTSAGINAIEAATLLFASLQEVEEAWNRPDKRHRCYGNHAHPVNFNLGKISGGDWASTVPCACSIDVRVGFYPDMELSEVRQTIEAQIHKAVAQAPELKGAEVEIEYRGFQAEGCVMDPEDPMMLLLGDSHRAVTGKRVETMASTATTDARFFQLYGKTPATCYGPISENIHGIDEWVSIESMMEVSQVLALFLMRWCGLERL